MQALPFEQAQQLCQHLAPAGCPATVHPSYVVADAARDRSLQPVFLHFHESGHDWMHNFHVTDIPDTPYKDASSPYGYGGPISTCSNPHFLHRAWQAYRRWMQDHGVVVEYVRFHPLLNNHNWYGGTVVPNRKVVWVDLLDAHYPNAYAARFRAAVAKAQSLGLVYTESALSGQEQAFGTFYRNAMRAMQTDPFFWFDDGYFRELAATDRARLGICRNPSEPQDAWLSACVLLEGDRVTEYHLAATSATGKRCGAACFVLHRCAALALQRGMHRLYLGGGSDRDANNSLLFFKAGMSPRQLDYHTGMQVFDEVGYRALQRHFADAWAAHPERPIFHRKV